MKRTDSALARMLCAAIFTILPPACAEARDPFSPFMAESDANPLAAVHSAESAAAGAQTSDKPIIHLLGTVNYGGAAYKLIEAGKQVRRVALKTPSPPYPVAAAAVSPANTPMSIDVTNIDLRALLQVFARLGNTNILASDSVKGSITVDLRNLTWAQALDVLLQSKGLASRRIGEVLWIAPQEELARRQKMEQTLAAAQVQQETLQGELFQLNYQKAETLRKLLHIGDDGRSKPNAGSSLLSARGSAIVDARTNQLLITDTPGALNQVRALIGKIDIASRQVLIQAYIVEANHQFSRNLGVRLGFATGNHGAAAASSGGPPADAPHRNGGALDLPARALGGLRAGQLALSLFNPSAGRFLSLELSALEADGQGRIVSSPRVVTADQQAALIEQGEEIPYQQAAGQGATSTAFKKANLKLQVTPQITPDDQIILNVDINKDSRGIATPGGLAINTKHIKTQVQVENDGTVVIGGIYTETIADNKTQVPLLGDLPVLGNLFKSTEKLHDKTELLIFLTPKIVGNEAAAGAAAAVSPP
ncbi:type IV pilus secretin PilQ [Oxalobacteraceae bacterium CAVE-383]|nr:type IV pilus secretin PilQ [Oxalobacteraceae bacterium CAVE-383]